MRWAEPVARMGEMKHSYKMLVGKVKGGYHFGDKTINGRIMLKWIFKQWGVGL
jgi:hypothetical protein